MRAGRHAISTGSVAEWPHCGDPSPLVLVSRGTIFFRAKRRGSMSGKWDVAKAVGTLVVEVVGLVTGGGSDPGQYERNQYGKLEGRHQAEETRSMGKDRE